MNLAMLGVLHTVECKNFFFDLSCIRGTVGVGTYTRWAPTAETSGNRFILCELHVGRDINKREKGICTWL